MKTICIDAGHGGHDPGAVSRNGIRESDVVLAVAMHTAKRLRAEGIGVILTRETDRFLQLTDRADIANRERVDLFLSIHCNAASNPAARGIETFVWTRTRTAEPWGERVQGAMVNEFPALPNRGLKRADFAVLRLTNMPAALAELEFLSNPEGSVMLADSINQRRYAEALARATMAQLGAPVVVAPPVDTPPEVIPKPDELAEIVEISRELTRRLEIFQRENL